MKTGEHSKALVCMRFWAYPPVRALWRNGLLIRKSWVQVPPPELRVPLRFKGFYMMWDALYAISRRAQDAFRSRGVMSTDVVWMASCDRAAIPLLHTASMPRGDGMESNRNQCELMRCENPVTTGVSRVSPGQRYLQNRTHTPKVAG